MLIACASIPRFELVAAVGERSELLSRPIALAPEPGGVQIVGDVSGAAGAFGVEPGMRVAEALGRCPSLVLVPPDPQRATERWEASLAKLEGVGAAIESSIRGEVFFGLDGLRAVLGSPERSLERTRDVLGGPVRLGAGPTRLCALAAALRSRRRRRSVIVRGAEANLLLRSLSIGVLRERMGDVGESASLVETLERLGLRSLGQLADLPDAAVADRFGPPGLRAQRLARGEEEPLRPRPAPEALRVGIELPEASAGGQLQRALEILLDRLLADRRRENRAIRRMRLEARLAAGGGWIAEVAPRNANGNRDRLLLALRPKLQALPAPASRLWLVALELGDAAAEQRSLDRDPGERRRGLIAEAVRQARAAGGSDAILRALEVDPGSSVPERRATLAPFEE
jgi:protein ImuB